MDPVQRSKKASLYHWCMSQVRIWVHLTFSTKYREPLLKPRSFRIKVFRHIKRYADANGLGVDLVNGYVDHVHCLVQLKADRSIAQVAKLLKGESSRYINENGLTGEHFRWQREYYAKAIDEGAVSAVRAYIKDQERRHRPQRGV